MATPHSSSHNKVSWSAKALIIFVRIYQLAISPLIGPRCRFNPTCSHYAIQALKQHGALKGGWLTCKRILKCHPLSAGGEDPVPPRYSNHKNNREN